MEGETAHAGALERYRDDGRLSDDELAWLCVLMQLLPVRDAAWRRIDNDDRDDWKVHERLWTDVLRRCAPHLAAPPGVLLSYIFWRSGEGLRAGVAIERALLADPRYPAANLMSAVLQQGVPPSVLDPLRRRRPAKPARARVARRRRR